MTEQRVFEYARLSSIGEALNMLRGGGADAKALTGGQSLLALVNLRLVHPTLLVDVADVLPSGVEPTDDHVQVGAGTPRPVRPRPCSPESCAYGGRATSCIGNVRVHNSGTVGGSLAHADAPLRSCRVC